MNDSSRSEKPIHSKPVEKILSVVFKNIEEVYCQFNTLTEQMDNILCPPESIVDNVEDQKDSNPRCRLVEQLCEVAEQISQLTRKIKEVQDRLEV